MGGDDGMNNWVCWGDRDIFREGGFWGSVRGLSLIIMQVSVIVFHHRLWTNSVTQIHERFSSFILGQSKIIIFRCSYFENLPRSKIFLHTISDT